MEVGCECQRVAGRLTQFGSEDEGGVSHYCTIEILNISAADHKIPSCVMNPIYRGRLTYRSVQLAKYSLKGRGRDTESRAGMGMRELFPCTTNTQCSEMHRLL